MRIKRLWICALCAAASFASASPDYLEPKPLSKTVTTQPGPVASGRLLLPIITWGGDINTIYANGNAKNTARDSLFQQNGLDFELTRNDVFADQVDQYISGRTPYLRGTLGMINSATDLLAQYPDLKPIIVHQLTWSFGGDALVVKSGINSVADLRGKTIALQAYGPHVDYMLTLLRDAGLTADDVTIKWVADLTGTSNSPMEAMYDADIDAAFVIIPDALALTSGGTVGDGSEDSVRGARVLMSTKTANRVIADVYAVRADYMQGNRSKVEAFVTTLTQAADDVRGLIRDTALPKTRELLEASAELLLDSKAATEDVTFLYLDAEHVDLNDNYQFIGNEAFYTNALNISRTAQAGLASLGLVSGNYLPAVADWDYAAMGANKAQASVIRFDTGRVANIVAQRQQQNSLADGELFSFQINFQPNQNEFNDSLYAAEFDRVVELAATYGGAIITVEGHSDPLRYLRSKQDGESELFLNRLKQSSRNISLSRAQSVQNGLIGHARNRGVQLDSSQFALVGHGFSQPQTGICNGDPCAPATEAEWRSNMRVVFRIIQLEAESNVFQPL